jgi:hypothetical protein
MKTIKDKVKLILQENPNTRDFESKLCYIYYTSFSDLTKDTSILDFFIRVENKKIPSTQTLTRLSRQLQEQNPELRGLEWEKRQRKQKKVLKDLGYEVRD